MKYSQVIIVDLEYVFNVNDTPTSSYAITHLRRKNFLFRHERNRLEIIYAIDSLL